MNAGSVEKRRENLDAAFLYPETNLGQRLRELAGTSHWDRMLGDRAALECKLSRCAYVSSLLQTREKRVIDFGSGMGFLSCYLAADGALRVRGVEILEQHRETSNFLAREVFGVENVEFAETADGIEPEGIDVALLTNVISHVYRPLETIAQLRDLLIPGGVLFIEDNNNLGSWFVRHRLPPTWQRAEDSYVELRRSVVGDAADETYGLTYEQAQFWSTRSRSDLASLRTRAPLDPESVIYHENAFYPDELASILQHAGFAIRALRPKYVFDFERRPLVSRLFVQFPRVALRVAPAFEIVAVRL